MSNNSFYAFPNQSQGLPKNVTIQKNLTVNGDVLVNANTSTGATGAVTAAGLVKGAGIDATSQKVVNVSNGVLASDGSNYGQLLTNYIGGLTNGFYYNSGTLYGSYSLPSTGDWLLLSGVYYDRNGSYGGSNRVYINGQIIFNQNQFGTPNNSKLEAGGYPIKLSGISSVTISSDDGGYSYLSFLVGIRAS